MSSKWNSMSRLSRKAFYPSDFVFEFYILLYRFYGAVATVPMAAHVPKATRREQFICN
jgi:hypothetical protein